MQCKFLEHGVAISYDKVIKPCCVWNADSTYSQSHKIEDFDIVHWHDGREISQLKHQLAQDQWPSSCLYCETLESSGRYDSLRGNGDQAYAHFDTGDITLEIRPGSICNFACQTCWPEASTRVHDFYLRAGIITSKAESGQGFEDFEFLSAVKDRIKNAVLLGGEPFYDPNCKHFLEWARDNLQCPLIIFTNGSMIDWQWIEQYTGSIILVFSLDAVGTAAEYVRFGTDWPTVWNNFQRAYGITNVEVRVNITVSIYNYFYLSDLVETLLSQWPSVVSFAPPVSISKSGIDQSTFDERLVPDKYRTELVTSLQSLINKIEFADIETGQKQNAVGTIQSLIKRLHDVAFDRTAFDTWRHFVKTMDSVKHIDIATHCPKLNRILQYPD